MTDKTKNTINFNDTCDRELVAMLCSLVKFFPQGLYWDNCNTADIADPAKTPYVSEFLRERFAFIVSEWPDHEISFFQSGIETGAKFLQINHIVNGELFKCYAFHDIDLYNPGV